MKWMVITLWCVMVCACDLTRMEALEDHQVIAAPQKKKMDWFNPDTSIDVTQTQVRLSG